MRRYATLLFNLFILHFCASAHNGSIEGQIRERDGGIELAGATVRLEPGDRYTSTNALGLFRFADLPAGTYQLTATIIGYETQVLQKVEVRNSESTVVRFDLPAALVDLREVDINVPTLQPLHSVGALDIRTRPVQTSQDVLRMVPGLFIAQHAGGGKAEQIFLRGFDIDHGTDINLSVDGMPVNMVSHAHGQGYADLHFVIPELIDNVDFQKGPYRADAGNFTTAGLARFHTADRLDKSFVKLEGGQYGTARAVGGFNLLGKQAELRNQHAYIASETFYSKGYFDSPQQFQRLNLFGKYSAMLDDEQKVTFSASLFQSNWDASGQIPERAVQNGSLGRFGAIDDTEGGQTSRYNFNFEHEKALSGNKLVKNQLFYSDFAFELYSNFTFFLEDPINGDQIRQKEHRSIFGYNGSLQMEGQLAGKKLQTELGLFVRNDKVRDNELSHTARRSETLQRLALGDVNETNAGVYLSETWQLAKKVTLNAALRADVFQFSYENHLDSAYRANAVTDGVVSPKLNLYYDVLPVLRLYANSGFGFHSNDTRVVVPQDGRQTLPIAKGLDLGLLFKPSPTLLVNLAAWRLDLDQEFVYVGDAGIVEPGGKTSRMGLDLSARLQLFRHLYADLDLTYSHARATEEPEGARYIPLAPRFTGTGGLNWDSQKGLFGSLRFRQLGDRAANVDFSLTAAGYFLLDAVGGWRHKNLEIGFSLQNLLNQEWKEAQFETESRLKNEIEPVSEIHFTPGTPFNGRVYVQYKF